MIRCRSLSHLREEPKQIIDVEAAFYDLLHRSFAFILYWEAASSVRVLSQEGPWRSQAVMESSKGPFGSAVGAEAVELV